MKPTKTEIVVDDPEIISRPVKVTETIYRLPPLNCPSPDINGSVGGFTMPEMIIWGQESWNWVSDCYNSIKSAESTIREQNIEK